MTTALAPGTPSWVELGTTDIDGAREFYGGTMGWTFTEDVDRSHLTIRSGGRPVGGLGTAADAAAGTAWSLYVAVDDVDAVTARADAAGGTVVARPAPVRDVGRAAVIEDPAGACLAVWQPGGRADAALLSRHGAMCWAELTTTDIEAAKRFYPQVLPVTTRDVTLEGVAYTLFEVDGDSVSGGCEIDAELGEVTPHWAVYFAVRDCDAAADRALALGATELLRETAPPGRMALMHDPQGGEFRIMTPNPQFRI